MTKTATIDVEVREHPMAPGAWIGIVTTARGRCYSCTWADRPTEEAVAKAWREDRKAFDPYTR